MKGRCPNIIKYVLYDFLYNFLIGVRNCPYGICCPWVRGGWGLDAQGKFFRRRRRRRRRRPLLLRFSKKVVILGISRESDMLEYLYLEGRFLSHNLELCRTRRKRLYVLQEINPRWLQMFFQEKLGLRSNT